MTKKTRLILFLIFLILFILIGPVVVLYSQGYRFDFEKKSLTQTGGFFLKALPKQAEIYINDKLVKKTDFFFGSALVENLLPKRYKVTVKKEGYHPWEKELEIKEKKVTEAKNIILFPKNPVFNILTKNVEDFWVSPDEKKIILYEKNNEGWVLKLYDLEKNIKSHLIDEKDISQKSTADFLDLEWSKDSKEIYLNVGIGEQEKSFTLKLDKIPPQLIERGITPIPEDIITSQTFNGDIYSLDKFGYLLKNGEKITENPFPVKPEIKYELNIFPEYIFLKEIDTLYLFNPDLKSFEKFFEGINNLKISPDNKKMVYFSNSEIWVLFLRENISQPEKKAGQKVFIIRLSEKIRDVFLLNSDYLIFNSGNNLKIVEIDDRDRINIINLAEFENPEIFFNQTDKKLYLLSEGNLYSSEKLLP